MLIGTLDLFKYSKDFSLLNLDDEPEGSLKKYLFGRESPVEAKKSDDDDEERPESPLGLLDLEADSVQENVEEQPSKVSFR